MNGHTIDVSGKPNIDRLEVIDLAIDFLFDGRSTSQCRGYLLSEYDINSDDLGSLLEKAQRAVREFELFNTRVKF
jgi:hypothetical protein